MAERNIRDVLVDHGLMNKVVKGMRREQYDAINAMNFSSLKESLIGAFDIDPVLGRDAYEQTRLAPSQDLQDSYDRGTLLHLILLQPEEIAGRVAVWDGKTRHGAAWEEFKAHHTGKLVMTARDVRDVQTACRAVRSIPEVRDLLRPCDTEVAIFTKEGSIFCKCLIDAVTREGEGLCVMYDPKSTRNGIDERSVDRQIDNLKYHEQLGWYRRCWNKANPNRPIEKAHLIFVSLPPQRAGVHVKTLTTAAMQWGELRVLQALERLEECLLKDEWPTYYRNTISDVRPWQIDDDMEFQGV